MTIKFNNVYVQNTSTVALNIIEDFLNTKAGKKFLDDKIGWFLAGSVRMFDIDKAILDDFKRLFDDHPETISIVTNYYSSYGKLDEQVIYEIGCYAAKFSEKGLIFDSYDYFWVALFAAVIDDFS